MSKSGKNSDNPIKDVDELVGDLTDAMESWSSKGDASEAPDDPWELPEAENLVEALKQAIEDQCDLRSKAGEEIEQMDSAALARQAYVMAYIKIRDYLRQPARKMSDKQAQARVGMDLVKHVESNKLASLVPGRSKSDDTLLDEVKKLREQMKKQARTSFEREQEEGGLLRKPGNRSDGGETIPSNPKAQA